MEDSTFTDQRVINLSKDMLFVKAEARDDTATREKYSIAGFPTVILMSSSGEEIDRIFGYLPAEEFVTTIQDYLQGKNTLEDLEKRFDADPQDPELAFRLAEKYEGRRMYEEAGLYYGKVLDLDPEDEKGKSDDALMSLGQLEVRKEDYLKGVDTFKYFLQKFPRSEKVADAELYIPYCYHRHGDTTTAVELYESFLVRYPDSPDTGWVKNQISKLKGEAE